MGNVTVLFDQQGDVGLRITCVPFHRLIRTEAQISFFMYQVDLLHNDWIFTGRLVTVQVMQMFPE